MLAGSHTLSLGYVDRGIYWGERFFLSKCRGPQVAHVPVSNIDIDNCFTQIEMSGFLWLYYLP